MTLTIRQKQILDFINKYSQKRGVSPSLEEIKKHFRLKSVSTIHQHIETLKQKGYLDKQKNQRRGIGLTNIGAMIKIPLMGTIAAGEPLTLFDASNETIA